MPGLSFVPTPKEAFPPFAPTAPQNVPVFSGAVAFRAPNHRTRSFLPRRLHYVPVIGVPGVEGTGPDIPFGAVVTLFVPPFPVKTDVSWPPSFPLDHTCDGVLGCFFLFHEFGPEI